MGLNRINQKHLITRSILKIPADCTLENSSSHCIGSHSVAVLKFIHLINLLGDPGAATYRLSMQYKTGDKPIICELSLS